MSDAEKKQIEGVCTEISEKNGWTSFSVDVGTTYPIRLSTKLAALIEQGRAASGKHAVWTYKESEGGPNPNKPGTNFTNRYMEGVEVGGTVTEAGNQPAASSSSPTHAPLPPGDKDRAITRMAVLKAAAEVGASIECAPGEDIAGEVIAMAARFETWVMRDVDEIPFG